MALFPTTADRDFQDRLTGPQLSREVEARLIHRAQAGDTTARETVIAANAAGIIDLAQRYTKRGGQAAGRLEYADILQEGLSVLNKCVDTFEPDRGTSFLGYVWMRARAQMFREKLTNESSLHMSRRVFMAMASTRTTSLELEAAGREVTAESVAAITGHPVDDVRDAMAMSKPPASLSEQRKGAERRRPVKVARAEQVMTSPIPAVDDFGQTAATPADLHLLDLFYGHGMTMPQVAAKLAIPTAQVRRMRAAAVERLGRPGAPPAYVSNAASTRRETFLRLRAQEVERSLKASAAQKAAAQRAAEPEPSPVREPIVIPRSAVLASLDQMQPKWHARLGLYAVTALAQGDAAARAAVGEKFGARIGQRIFEPLNLLISKLPTGVLPADASSRELRSAVLPALADRFERRTSAIELLPPGTREMMHSFFVDGESVLSMADRTGIARDVVARLRAEGLERVRELEVVGPSIRTTAAHSPSLVQPL